MFSFIDTRFRVLFLRLSLWFRKNIRKSRIIEENPGKSTRSNNLLYLAIVAVRNFAYYAYAKVLLIFLLAGKPLASLRRTEGQGVK